MRRLVVIVACITALGAARIDRCDPNRSWAECDTGDAHHDRRRRTSVAHRGKVPAVEMGWAIRSMIANPAGRIQAAETSIHGLRRCGNRTAQRYSWREL